IRFAFTKDFIHLTYVLYIFSLSLFSLSRIDGLGFEYLWPNHPNFNVLAPQISLALFIGLSMFFASSFLNIQKTQPSLFILVIAWICIRFIGTAIAILYFPTFDFKSIDLSTMVLLLIANYNSKPYIKLSQGLFLISYSCMLTGFVVYSLQDWKIIPHTFLGYYALNMGVFIETILLSMAISEKTRIILVERQKAQKESIKRLEENQSLQFQLLQELSEKEKLKDKINLELEQKVKERTEELQTKNLLLQEQKLKIENLASQIDKQYFFLQRETSTSKMDSL
ncbi:MAG: hypothetical protein K2Q22_01375, partial [Cytophagales bacterium]|nr:hypothetical protein [Cytophagales bacterium]